MGNAFVVVYLVKVYRTSARDGCPHCQHHVWAQCKFWLPYFLSNSMLMSLQSMLQVLGSLHTPGGLGCNSWLPSIAATVE